MSAAEDFGRYLCSGIPMAAHMGVTCGAYAPDGVMLTAAAEPNMNNHGSIFGGSIGGLAILAGWGMVKRLLEEIDPAALIVIRGSELSFDRPVTGAYTASAVPPPADEREKFAKMYARRGMGKMVIEVRVGPTDAPGAVMRGTYVVTKTSTAS